MGMVVAEYMGELLEIVKIVHLVLIKVILMISEYIIDVINGQVDLGIHLFYFDDGDHLVVSCREDESYYKIQLNLTKVIIRGHITQERLKFLLNLCRIMGN